MADLCSSVTSIHPCDFHPREGSVGCTFQVLWDHLRHLAEQRLMQAHPSSCPHPATLAAEPTSPCMDILLSSDHPCRYDTTRSSAPSAGRVGRHQVPESNYTHTLDIHVHCIKHRRKNIFLRFLFLLRFLHFLFCSTFSIFLKNVH